MGSPAFKSWSWVPTASSRFSPNHYFGHVAGIDKSKTAKCADFAQQGLEIHNELRALHGVPPLELDSQLTAYAQEWADNLASSGSFYHRPNSNYGENLYMAGGSLAAACDGKPGVQAWYDEISMYNFGNGGFSGATGHFTQVVWKNSKKLGYAQAFSGNRVYVVANYDPPGNSGGPAQYTENVPPPQGGTHQAPQQSSPGQNFPFIFNPSPVFNLPSFPLGNLAALLPFKETDHKEEKGKNEEKSPK